MLEVMEKEIAAINKVRQKRWSLVSCLPSAGETPFVPIALPTNGLLSDVMVCSRCGSRRQIRNTPFSALTLPVTCYSHSSL